MLALINKLRPGFYGLRRYSDPTSYGGVALHEFIADFNALNLGPTKAFTILDLTEDSYVGFFKVFLIVLLRPSVLLRFEYTD